HPLRWSPQEALRFLSDIPQLEQAGVVVRMPAAWRAGRPPRPQVIATVGGKAPSGLGTDALLDFRMEVTLDGERLTSGEVKQLLAGTDGLQLIRGQWVHADRERLEQMLERFQQVERLAAEGGVTFAEALRTVAGAWARPFRCSRCSSSSAPKPVKHRPACWWLRLRCSPTGLLRSSGSRPT